MPWTWAGYHHKCRAAAGKSRAPSKWHIDIRINRVKNLSQRWKQWYAEQEEKARQLERKRLVERAKRNPADEIYFTQASFEAKGSNGITIEFDDTGLAIGDRETERYLEAVIVKSPLARGYCVVTCNNTDPGQYANKRNQKNPPFLDFTLPINQLSRVDNPVTGKAVADPSPIKLFVVKATYGPENITGKVQRMYDEGTRKF